MEIFILIAVALVLGFLANRKPNGSFFPKKTYKPIDQVYPAGSFKKDKNSLNLSKAFRKEFMVEGKTFRGNPVKKLEVKSPLQFDDVHHFKGTVSDRAIRCYIKRNKCDAVVITAKQLGIK